MKWIHGPLPFLMASSVLAAGIGVFALRPWQQAAQAVEIEGVGLTGELTGVIAVQVRRNPQRLDPLAWYRSQDFPQGNPRGTAVDGFPAVAEGTTVYVSAPNYTIAPPSAYVNMYLLLYGQGSDNSTQEIARRLRENWQFMSNLPPNIPEGPAIAKEKLRRDNQRLTGLGTILQGLQAYRAQHGSYPTLAAGSYLPGQSVSTWPSWQETLGQTLGQTLPLDPLNSFDTDGDGTSDCDAEQGFAADTCFASPGTSGGGAGGAYQCPDGAHVFEYERTVRTKLYANFEFKIPAGTFVWADPLPGGNQRVEVGPATHCRSTAIDVGVGGGCWNCLWPDVDS